MTTYHFEDITAPLALGYKAASDTLLFTTPGTTGANTFAVVAVVPTDTQAVTITLTSVPLGRAVTFGDGLKGETVTFPDSSVLLIGTSGNDVLTGGPFGDGLYGGFGDDTLNGGAGDDVLDAGGPGAEVLTGGPGSDLFIFRGAAISPRVDVFTPHITDWESVDRLAFSSRTTTGYAEMTASGTDDPYLMAETRLESSGGQYFAVASGSDVIVFADRDGDHHLDVSVILTGRTLADIDIGNFVPIPGTGVTPISPPPPPSAPAPPEPSSQLAPIGFGGGGGAQVFVTGTGDALDLNAVANLPLVDASSDRIAFQGPTLTFEMHGTFIYSGDNLVGGTIQTQFLQQGGLNGFTVSISGLSIPVQSYLGWASAGDTASLTNAIYGGNDVFIGSLSAEAMQGLGGNDSMDGRGGNDTILGGVGDDAIQGGGGATSQTYLRGEEGNDTIFGGQGFDDINGNQGNDTISGGQGDDWVVGGKDNDLQFGGDGDDIVWGNLGNDTLEGGVGADQIRGGQGDDILFGDAGNDYISGDRGNDSEVGGAGADIFHSFSGAGIDKVFDFNAGDGDRVMLDPGTTFAVSQVGQDTVIDMGNGDQVILVGVLASTLPPGTIFLG